METVESIPEAISLFGYPITPVTLASVMSRVKEALAERQPLHVVTANPEMLMQAQSNPPLHEALMQADLLLPDGAGVVWALRKRGYKTVQRVPGIEFSEHLLAHAASHNLGVALIGTDEETLAAARDKLCRRFAGLNIVYAHHGFYHPEEEATIAQACGQKKPQVVLVALGVPRQELWIAQYRPNFPDAVLVGIGGSLDVWSGRKQRAPEIFRALNLEWLYRITSEPWRIGRVSKTLPAFAWRVLVGH